MKKKIVIILIISAVIVGGFVLVSTLKARSPYPYYYLTDHKQYFLANMLVQTGIFKPDFYDLCDFYGEIDFKYIKAMVNKTNMELAFVPLISTSMEEEIAYFLSKGADINAYYVSASRRLSLTTTAHIMRTEFPIIYMAIQLERYDLIPFLLDRGANPFLKVKIYGNGNYDINDSYWLACVQYDLRIFSCTPREFLEQEEKSIGMPGKFSREIKLLKEYEIKYDKEHPSWRENERKYK